MFTDYTIFNLIKEQRLANSLLKALTWVPLTRGSAPAHSPLCTGCSWQTRCSSAAAHLPGWHLPKHSHIFKTKFKFFVSLTNTLKHTNSLVSSLPSFQSCGSGMFIPDSGSKTFRIPDPGSESASRPLSI